MRNLLLLSAILLGCSGTAAAASAETPSPDLVANGFIIMSTVLVILMCVRS